MFLRSGLARYIAVFFLAVWVLFGSSGTVLAMTEEQFRKRSNRDINKFKFDDSAQKRPDTSDVDPKSTYIDSSLNKMAQGGVRRVQTKIPKGKRGLIKSHGLCAKILNNTKEDIFVPAGTKEDYEAFLEVASGRPEEFELSKCDAPAPSLSPSASAAG